MRILYHIPFAWLNLPTGPYSGIQWNIYVKPFDIPITLPLPILQ